METVLSFLRVFDRALDEKQINYRIPNKASGECVRNIMNRLKSVLQYNPESIVFRVGGSPPSSIRYIASADHGVVFSICLYSLYNVQ